MGIGQRIGESDGCDLMPLYFWPPDTAPAIRSKAVTLPLLTLGSTDQTITWATPMPDANYTVQCLVETGAVNVGKITAAPKQGTITANGLTVTCANALLVSLAAGAVLHVTATQLTE